ncbi:nucleotidyltransferase domain-containing protein [Nostoc sp.]
MESFSELVELSGLLNDFRQPWFVAGGWAIDLFIGDVTRVHKDIEIAIFRKDQSSLREYLFGWEFTKVVDGKMEPWNENEWLELPIHEIHALGIVFRGFLLTK